jgi:hypothetical protein
VFAAGGAIWTLQLLSVAVSAGPNAGLKPLALTNNLSLRSVGDVRGIFWWVGAARMKHGCELMHPTVRNRRPARLDLE